jgi:hypothetical protein
MGRFVLLLMEALALIVLLNVKMKMFKALLAATTS